MPDRSRVIGDGQGQPTATAGPDGAARAVGEPDRQPAQPGRLVELLDGVLNAGVAADAEISIGIADRELVRVSLKLLAVTACHQALQPILGGRIHAPDQGSME